jgi:HTH-type transcriptional regulator, sugar sensing transcriptional regulator
MDSALTAVLEQLGLTQVEAKVYLALLENGNQQAGAITKLSGIHRRTVYDAISRLIEKGLISYIKSGKIRLYQATHPERLLELVKEQERGLSGHMAHLEALFDAQPSRHETVFFRGKKGLKALFDDQLKAENNTILMLGATPAAMDVLEFYLPQHDRARIKSGIKAKLLFDRYQEIKRMPLTEVRVLQTETPQDVVTCIYGDTVSIITFSDNPFGILIREQAIAEQYRNYFAILWKAARPA